MEASGKLLPSSASWAGILIGFHLFSIFLVPFLLPSCLSLDILIASLSLYLVSPSSSIPEEAEPFLSKSNSSLSREEVQRENREPQGQVHYLQTVISSESPCLCSSSLGVCIPGKETMASLSLISPVSAVACVFPVNGPCVLLAVGRHTLSSTIIKNA